MVKHAFAFAAPFVLVLTVAACGGKSSDGGAPSAATSAAATTPPPPPPPASAAATPPATASAAPADSAAGAEGGKVHIHMDGARVTKGKAEGAEKTLKGHMLKLRTTCIRAEAKKQPLDGTLKVTIDLTKEGKADKVHTAVATGTVPEDVASCVKSFYEKHVELDTNKGKATVEVTIAMGPKVQPDK